MADPLSVAIELAVLVLGGAALLRWYRSARIRGLGALIGEAMRRRGITPADAEAAGLANEMTAAVQRCGACTSAAGCRVAMSRFGRWNLPEVCPNRQFLDRVADHKARADTARIFSGWR
jgi:hypothetical protein